MIRISTIIIVLFFCFASQIVLAGFICEEALVDDDMNWSHPTLPEPAADQSSSREYCDSNPHSFKTSSASISPHRTPMICYNSDSGELIVELPNRQFSRCATKKRLNQLPDDYALSVAMSKREPFTLIIYNEKHNFYKKGRYGQEHEIWTKVLNMDIFHARSDYISKQRKEGILPIESIACVGSNEMLDGSPCPWIMNKLYPLNTDK